MSELLDTVLERIYDDNSRRRDVTMAPERMLQLAILEQAIEDYAYLKFRRFGYTTGRSYRDLSDVETWIEADGPNDNPMSQACPEMGTFVGICESLGINADSLREKIRARTTFGRRRNRLASTGRVHKIVPLEPRTA